MDGTELEIERVILRRVRIPLLEPFRISNGSVSEKESVVIELYSGDNVGYGEASPMSGSFYSGETPDSTWQALANDLVPDLMGRTVQSPVSYATLLNAYTKEPFARAGIEGAVWHLAAAKLNTSIRALIGAPTRPIESGLAVGIFDSIDRLLDRIEHYLKQGYRRTKIKIQPGWDIEPLRAVRDKFGDIPLMVDANGAYNFPEHSQHLLELDAFDLMMIEQPFATQSLKETAALRVMIRTPICVDESAENLSVLEEIIQLDAAQIVNIKVQRVGGLWNAKRMHDRAHQAGLSCWLGTMPELGIASAQSLALATLPGFVYPTDVEESDRWFVDDIVEPKITIADGILQIPDSGPMGYEVSTRKLEQYTVQMQTFERGSL